MPPQLFLSHPLQVFPNAKSISIHTAQPCTSSHAYGISRVYADKARTSSMQLMHASIPRVVAPVAKQESQAAAAEVPVWNYVSRQVLEHGTLSMIERQSHCITLCSTNVRVHTSLKLFFSGQNFSYSIDDTAVKINGYETFACVV